MPILDWYLDDDLTTLDDEPIPGLAAGSYSDAVELHLWVDKGSPSPQPAANVRVVLDTEDPASAGTFRRSGLPPQDELWGWMRVVGFDNTGDPTWTIPATGWQPVGAYAALPLGTIPGDCAVHLEVRFRPPVSAPELAWRFRPGAIYDEYAQPVPPVVTALGSGVLTGVGDGTRFGVVSGLALTPSSPADDEVHVAAGVWLHRGALYAQVASDHQLDQDDGDSAALTSGESYWAALSGGAGTITVTKGLKGAAPAKPAPPAGEPLLGFVRVAYQAGGSEIASAHLDVSAVVADRYRCEADGLDVVISAGQALGGGTLRYHFGSTRLTLDPSTTSYLWQLTSGLFEITEDIADRPEPSALLFWEVETDASAVTAIHDHRRYAGRTVCLRLAGAAPVSPGFVADLQVEHPLLYVDEVVFRVSDPGSGSSGSTVGEWFVDGVTAYTSQATDDQRPEIAHDATVLATREGVAELRELRRGQVVSFETAAYPSGGKPERVELILVCREA